MSQFEVTYTKDLGQRVRLLSLRPKSRSDCFDYEPGQYVAIGFRRFGRRTPMRCFSIVSSPTQPELQVAMRVSGSFTKTSLEVKAGDDVYVQGAFGEFVLNPGYDNRVVMAAGGIGITPFISMLRWATEKNMQTQFTLLYSCKTQTDIPFYEELLDLQQRNPNIQVVFFITGNETLVAEPGIVKIAGSINGNHLEKVTGGVTRGVTYFLCGPKGFMTGIEKSLVNIGVTPDRIVTESFTQSSKLSFFSGWTPSSLTYAFAAILMVVGVGGVMLVDLARSVPRLVSAQTTSSSQLQAATTTPTTSTSTSTQSTPTTSTNSSSSTNNTSNTGTSSTTQNQSSTNQNYYYRQPVSSVS